MKFLAHNHEPQPPCDPWAPLVHQVEARLRAGATARVVGPYVEVRLEGRPLILTDQAVYEAALKRLQPAWPCAIESARRGMKDHADEN
jgi:hypothetical protein